MPGPRLHLLIPTHTTRHLDTCLASLAAQTSPPDSVVVTCDSDAPGLAQVIDDVLPRALPPSSTLLHTFRPHQGAPRLNQVRNNGLRALEHAGRLADHDLVLIIDGDTALPPPTIAAHRALTNAGARLILASRINLDQARTATLTPERLLGAGAPGAFSTLASDADRADLARRQRRLERQLLFRTHAPAWLHLVKPHKPKLLGGHHAVGVAQLRAVNGYDEHFRGDGTDDDDLARRLYLLRPRVAPVIAANDIPVFHLYHETRRPWRPDQAPDHARFARRGVTARTDRGWLDPLAQPEPTIRVLRSSPN